MRASSLAFLQEARQIGVSRGRCGEARFALLFAQRGPLKEAVREVLRRAAGRPGFIFNLGHGILPGTPVENVKAVVDWVHAWSLN